MQHMRMMSTNLPRALPHRMAARWLSPWLLLVLALIAAGDPDRSEQWFEVKVAGALAGWTHSLQTQVPEGWRTENKSRLRLSRGGTVLDMSTSSWIVESASGVPISGGRTQTGSGQSVRATWTYSPTEILERTMDGAHISTRTLPPAAAIALPPHASEVAAAAQRRAGAQFFSQLIFEASQGPAPQAVTCTRESGETLSIVGAPIATTRWKLSGAFVPPGSLEWRGDDDALLRSLSPTGLGDIESVRSTEQRAKAALDRAGAAPEIMVASFAKPDRPLSDPMKLRKMVVRITPLKGQITAPPSVGAQRVEKVGESFQVSVDMDQPASAASEVERGDPAFITASPMIDSNDPEIINLAKSAVVDAPNEIHARMQRLRAATFHRLEKKNLSSAFASASEAVRTRSGDCTEHAVLLAALLRTQGIPSRVVAGLVWCEQFVGAREVFGWHMWTQALIDGRWNDLDATMPVDGAAFHPAHIALATTALCDPAGDPSFATLLAALGNLKIEVLDGAR